MTPDEEARALGRATFAGGWVAAVLTMIVFDRRRLALLAGALLFVWRLYQLGGQVEARGRVAR